ncbi:MAG: DUF2169 domain-containing protein [Myxococcota bacterium]
MGEVECVELGPLKGTTLLWRPKADALVLTVIAKVSYALQAGTLSLASAPDDVNERDLHAQNNPAKGLYSASDLAPFKAEADVTVVGKAFAPPGELAKALVARLVVGPADKRIGVDHRIGVDKRIEVHAERYLRRDGRLRDRKFFSKMALGYEKAPGGEGTKNPVGMALVEQSDGRILLPHLQAVGETPSLQTPLTPCGLGPIPAGWPSRRRMLDDTQQRWVDAGDWRHEPVPDDMNWGFFNVAPADQRLAEIPADATIRLEHLHPDAPTLEMSLPGHAPRAYLEQGDDAKRVQMKGDTLWIDTNRLRCTLTWRGTIAVDDEDELRTSRVIVALVEPGQELTWETAWHLAEAQRHRSLDASSDAPPPSSSHEVKTRIARPASSRRDGQRTIEMSLTDAEVGMLRDLGQAMGYPPEATLRHVLREAHQVRFGPPPSSLSSSLVVPPGDDPDA